MFDKPLTHKSGITWSTLRLANDYTITRYYVPIIFVECYIYGKQMRKEDVVYIYGKAYRIVVIQTLSMMQRVKVPRYA